MTADERFYPKDLNLDFEPFMRHYERYVQCVKLLGRIGKNEFWLDCACGSGYGSRFLSNFCERVAGYDISFDAVQYARENYKIPYKTAFTSNFNELVDARFNAIISVETIEHMEENEALVFLESLRTLLLENGELVITTPIVSETNRNPKNEFHCIEYSNEDFRTLLTNTGFEVQESIFIETTFTDGETKDQGYYRCTK
jgi:2-polyprenyl-3-methyl-5-hydroxy-6-metoxy-1,4-benzoquinol methylase